MQIAANTVYDVLTLCLWGELILNKIHTKSLDRTKYIVIGVTVHEICTKLTSSEHADGTQIQAHLHKSPKQHSKRFNVLTLQETK